MQVGICFDGNDLLQKQLRYLLYPTPVRRIEEYPQEATHIVLIDTDRGLFEDGTVLCGDTFQRPAEELAAFPQESFVLRFTDIP